jgi:pimeloyl-ACP methyl ester carboxylesterase
MPFVNVNGIDLFWREAGSGPPIVLIMGMETDHRGWARIARSLKNQFRCISLDNRDIGQSSFASEPYQASDMAADTIGLIDHLGLDKVALIGQSMGGTIAQELARRFPDRIDRMVLISSYSTFNNRARSAVHAWKAMRQKLSLREYYASVFPWMYTIEEYDRPGFVQHILDKASANPKPQPYDAFCRHVDAVAGFDSSPWIRDLSVKTLVVSGAEDMVTTPADAFALASGLKGSGDPIIIQGTSHGLAMTNAIDHVVPEISDFLAS